MDGHDSHFDSEAVDLLASKHVYVFFLKSNNSEEDQPNDNGPNRSFTALYDLHYDDWLHQSLAMAPYMVVHSSTPCSSLLGKD